MFAGAEALGSELRLNRFSRGGLKPPLPGVACYLGVSYGVHVRAPSVTYLWFFMLS